MKKKSDSLDKFMNLAILALLVLLVDQYWFASEIPEAVENIAFVEPAPPRTSPSLVSATHASASKTEEPLETVKTVKAEDEPSSIDPALEASPLDLEALEAQYQEHLKNKQNEILIYKKEHELFLIDSAHNKIGPFHIAIGKNPDLKPKEKEGDKRTPEGEYHITAVMDEKHEILQSWNDLHLSVQAGHHKFGKPFEDLGRNSYGPCFLMLNYPNSEDKKRGRTGSGIGIHGTNDPISLGNPATSGCIRMRNVEIVWLSQWLKRGTPVKILASSTEN